MLLTLASTEATQEDVDQLSLFTKDTCLKEGGLERQTYVDDEAACREAFAKAYDDQMELIADSTKVIDVFRGYQIQAEQLMLAKEKNPHQDLAISVHEKETFRVAGPFDANPSLPQT